MDPNDRSFRWRQNASNLPKLEVFRTLLMPGDKEIKKKVEGREKKQGREKREDEARERRNLGGRRQTDDHCYSSKGTDHNTKLGLNRV